jgi:hypothetical protein
MAPSSKSTQLVRLSFISTTELLGSIFYKLFFQYIPSLELSQERQRLRDMNMSQRCLQSSKKLLIFFRLAAAVFG